MGNPHVVFFVPEIHDQLVLEFGPKIERDEIFPERVNVEFARIINAKEIEMRVWERGSGETLACGTGACAVLVAAHLNGLCERDAVVHLLGGDLKICWQESGMVTQTGPASFTCDGIIRSDWLEEMMERVG